MKLKSLLITAIMVIVLSISISALSLPFSDMESTLDTSKLWITRGTAEITADPDNTENHVLSFTSTGAYGVIETNYERNPLVFEADTDYSFSMDIKMVSDVVDTSWTTVSLYSYTTGNQINFKNFGPAAGGGNTHITYTLKASDIDLTDDKYTLRVLTDKADCTLYIDNVVFEPIVVSMPTLLPFSDMESDVDMSKLSITRGTGNVIVDPDNAQNHVFEFAATGNYAYLESNYETNPLTFTENSKYLFSMDLRLISNTVDSSWTTISLYSHTTGNQHNFKNFGLTNGAPSTTITYILDTANIDVTDTNFAVRVMTDKGDCTIYIDNVVFEPFGNEKIKILKNQYSGGEKIAIAYNGTSEKDWVAIYDKGKVPSSGDNGYGWSYAYENGSGVVSITLPTTPGEYTLNYFENDSYTISKSINFTIVAAQSKYKVTIPKTQYMSAEEIYITFDEVDSPWNWIAVFEDGKYSGNGMYKSFRYLNEGAGVYKLKAPVTKGTYSVYLNAGDGSILAESQKFTVVAPQTTTPEAPISVTYTRDASAPNGTVNGSITATASDTASDGVLFYWGTESGRLADYTFIGYAGMTDIENRTYTYYFTENNLIPEGATHILAYGCNGSFHHVQYEQHIMSADYASCEINASPIDLGKMLYSFEVMSDVHVLTEADNPPVLNGKTNLERSVEAFTDIQNNFKETAGIFVVGDFVDKGTPEQYALAENVIQTYLNGLNRYYAVGNHEFYFNETQTGAFDENWERFRDYTGIEDGAYYFYIVHGGDYFIFMGAEERGEDTAQAYFSPEQFAWVQSVVDLAKTNNANAFVFIHQPIDNSVAGTFRYKGQYNSGVNDDEALRAVIDSYEKAFLFTGHSHYNLYCDDPFAISNGNNGNYFNTASAGYLWYDTDNFVPGSHGLHVEVYENCVVVKGRDYSNQLYVPNVNVAVSTANDNVPLNLGAISVHVPEYTDMVGLRFAAFIDKELLDSCNEFGFMVADYDILTANNGKLSDLVFDGDFTPTFKKTTSGTTPSGVKFICSPGLIYEGTNMLKTLFTEADGTAKLAMSRDAEGTYFTAILKGLEHSYEVGGTSYNNMYSRKYAIRPYVKIGSTYYYGAVSVESAKTVAKRQLARPDLVTASGKAFLETILNAE